MLIRPWLKRLMSRGTSWRGSAARVRAGVRSVSPRQGIEALEARVVLAAEAVIVEDGVAGGGINPGNANSSPRSFTDVNGTVYFSATDAANGTELWRINGSGVAELVEDAVPGGGIYPGSSGSYPTDLMNVNGTLYFRAAEDNSFGSVEYDPHGYELWRINGSGVAELVEDAVPGGGINPGG